MRALVIALAFTIGCGGSTSGAICGEGTVERGGVCVVRDDGGTDATAIDATAADTLVDTHLAETADVAPETETGVDAGALDAAETSDPCKDPKHLDCVACSSFDCESMETRNCDSSTYVPPLMSLGDQWSIRLPGHPPNCTNCFGLSPPYPAYRFESLAPAWSLRVKVTPPWYVYDTSKLSALGSCPKTRQTCVVLRRVSTSDPYSALVFMDPTDAGVTPVDATFELVKTDATCP